MSSPAGLRLARRTGTAGRPEWSRPRRIRMALSTAVLFRAELFRKWAC